MALFARSTQRSAPISTIVSVTGLSVMLTKALRAALGAARVAVDLDKSVGEIDGGVVLHPVGAELDPVFAIAGLVVANQVADHFGLRRVGHTLRLREIFIGALQINGIKPGQEFFRRAFPRDRPLPAICRPCLSLRANSERVRH